MSSILIEDGFTLTATLPARHGLPAVTVEYRLALPERVYSYLHDAQNGEQRSKKAAKLLADHLVSWDARTRNGNAIPIDERTLSRVAHPVLERLLSLVTGYGPDERAADEKN